MFRDIRANVLEEETIRTNLMRPAKKMARMLTVLGDKGTIPRNRVLYSRARVFSHLTKI